MFRKVILPVLSVLLTGVMLLVSCGPRGAPTSTPVPVTPAPIPAAPTLAPALTPAPATTAEEPKYGGTITLVQPENIEIFSPAAAAINLDSTLLHGAVYEQYLNVDWTKGPAGTGEASYGETATDSILRFEYMKGYLAESFEIPSNDVWVLNIRKGVHYALDPKSEASRLMNGREVTADDVVWSINYMNTTPNSGLLRTQPGFAKNATVEKTGPWQVTVRTPVDPAVTFVWVMGGGLGGSVFYAKEAAEKYGKTNDWWQTVGTGPYMLTDFVPGSAATLTRNPNYWQKNPVGPGKGDQLPYPDGLKVLIVPDLSTRLAVMRTARADRINGVPWEDAQSLLESVPTLQPYRYISPPMVVAMRTDKPDLPYKDKRVRQALHMAIDREAIKKELYQGQAEILAWPLAPSAKTLYISLEQLPESAKTLFNYNPARAKQLLAEAGYPSGFKAKIIVRSAFSEMDSVAILKAMWAKVGVDLEIQPKESSVYNSVTAGAGSHEELVFRTSSQGLHLPARYNFAPFRYAAPSYFNNPPGKEPIIEAALQEMQKYVPLNYPKADQLYHELIPYILEQAYYTLWPTPYDYRLWQPWLKNYYGEGNIKYWIPYAWVDQDLKEVMTGRR